jgi:hypothetical protein
MPTSYPTTGAEGAPTIITDGPEGRAEITLGNQQAINEFYAAIGYAVNHWAHVDRVLFELTCFAFGAPEELTAIAYYKFRNQSDRIELTNELLAKTDLGKLSGVWTDLYAEVRRLSPMRNAVAHQPLTLQTTITNVSHITPEKPLKIENFMWVDVDEKELLAGKKKSKRIELSDLAKYVGDLKKLNETLIKFRDELTTIAPNLKP